MAFLVADSWDWAVAGTAVPVVGRRAFLSRRRANLEAACCWALIGIPRDLSSVARMLVRVLGLDHMGFRVCRSQDGVGGSGSEVRYHGGLADNFRLVGGALPFPGSFGVGIRQYTLPRDKFEVLASSICLRILGLGERCRSRHAVGDGAFEQMSWYRCSVGRG